MDISYLFFPKKGIPFRSIKEPGQCERNLVHVAACHLIWAILNPVMYELLLTTLNRYSFLTVYLESISLLVLQLQQASSSDGGIGAEASSLAAGGGE